MKPLSKNREKALFLIFDIGLNGFNYLFHIAVSRASSGSDYGRFNALMSFASILFVIGISFQSYIGRSLVQDKKIRREMHSVAFNAFIYITAVLIIVLIFHSRIETFLRISFRPLLMVLGIFILNVALSIGRGIFQAREQFLRLNISFYLEVLTKILLLVLFLRASLNLEKVIFCLLAGMLVSFIHTLIAARPQYRRLLRSWKMFSEEKKSVPFTFRKIAFVIAGNIFLYYLTALDMLIVNNRLPENSGIFAVVLRYSQLIFFAGFSLFALLTPGLNRAASDYSVFIKTWLKQLALLACLLTVSLAGFKWILPWTVVPLFGSNYAEAGNYFVVAAAAYSLLLLIFYLVTTFIAIRDSYYLIFLSLLAVILPIGLIRFSSAIYDVLFTEMILFGAAASVLIIYALIRFNKLRMRSAR